MDLENAEEFKKIDGNGVYNALMLFPDQIRETWKQAFEADIPIISPEAVVVSGMGGSSNAAKIIQGLFEDRLKIPFIVHNDYGLPAWVNEKTLVIGNSYSGNTEETLSGLEIAQKIGAKIFGIATGGKIADMVHSGQISGSVISPGKTNPPDFPKSGLGVSLGGLMGVLAKAGILPVSEEELLSSLENLVEIRNNWDAKQMSAWLFGHMPVLFGGRPFLGSLNAGRNAMCEISRNFTQFYDFPEVNHVLIEATQKPEGVSNLRYVFFESVFNSERVKTRFAMTKKIFDEQGLTYSTYSLKGKTYLTQALELSHYCAWLGFYISMLGDVDPGPEPWILKLKSALSQPLH